MELIQLLSNLGYKENQINRIINHHSLKRYKEELALRIPQTFMLLINYNFSNKKVIKMTSEAPGIYAVPTDHLETKIKELKNIGYDNNQINKLLIANPNILVYSTELLKTKIHNLEKIGYTYQQILAMSLKLATIYDLDIEENIMNKFNILINIGFTKEQVIKMTINHPDIFSYSKENILKKIEDLQKLGFNINECIILLSQLPTLFGLTISNITKKIEYLKRIDGINFILKRPKCLMQSIELMFSRNEFLMEKDIQFESHEKKIYELFIGQSIFEKKYKISKEQLFTKYNYKKYCEEKGNGKSI